MRSLVLLFSSSIFSLLSYSQSTQMFDLESEIGFADSRIILSNDSTYSPLIDAQGKGQSIYLHPLYEVNYGYDNDSGSIFRWGLGGQLNYQSDKVNAGITYLFNRGQFMGYRSALINDRSMVPGAVRKSGLKTMDVHYWDAYLSFQPNEIFDFEVGYGRKFIGSGHRSLLLSDLSAPYPYLKIQTKFWKLNYTNLFSQQLNTFGVVGDQDLYRQKYTASHYLELKLFDRLSIGVFETVIWQSDEGSYIRGVDPNYLNPVIFYRPVEFSTGSSDNVIIGANLDYEFVPNYHFYFQLLLDEFLISEIRADVSQAINEDENIESGWWGNKYGLQVGFKSDLFVGVEGLSIRLEYNLVRPYTYAHSSPTQAYSHKSLALAHPLGANFEEFISQLQFRKEKWTYSLQFNQSRRGISPLGTNLGEEIEVSNSSRSKEYENFIGQGIPVFTRYFELGIRKRVRFLWGAEWGLSYAWREQTVRDAIQMNNMVLFSIRTNVFRSTMDY